MSAIPLMKEAKERFPEKGERPSWDEYFMAITRLVASRSTCLRRSVGAVLVKRRNILTTGYNGAPSGLPHCRETGCRRMDDNVPSGQRAEICRGLHAEQNAIVQAAFHGISIEGATLYCTNQPCSICMKMIINAGIAEVVFENSYDDPLSDELVKQSGIKLRKYEGGGGNP